MHIESALVYHTLQGVAIVSIDIHVPIIYCLDVVAVIFEYLELVIWVWSLEDLAGC